MFDIDAGHGHPLRLVASSTSRERLSHTIDRLHRESIEGPAAEAAEVLRAAQRDVEAAHARWIDAYANWEVSVAQSRPIPASPPVLTMSNDFWDHRHRVMAGPDPKIARTTGHIERLNAAARGEIADPAYGLRGTPTDSAEVLHEDDGA